MKNFKALALSALVATTTLVAGATGAQAANYECYNTTDYDRVCVYDVRGNSYERQYKMEVNGRYAGTHIAYCNPNHRYNYKQNAIGKVCFEFN